MASDPTTRDVAVRMANCAARLGLAIEQQDGDQLRTLIESGRFCGARLCPFCEWRRVRAWRARLLPGLEALATDRPTDSAVFLTLTVRNVPVAELRATLQGMHKAWDRLVKWSGFPTPYWLRRTEITLGRPSYVDGLPQAPSKRAGLTTCRPGDQNEPDGSRFLAAGPGGRLWAHPHIHCLAIVPASYWSHGYVRKTEWARQWAMALRADYTPVVDVRRATSTEGGDDPAIQRRLAVMEAAKYASKATDLHALGDYVSEFHHQLRSLRLIAASKKLRQYVNDANITEAEMLDTKEIGESGNPLIRCIATWCEAAQEYTIRP